MTDTASLVERLRERLTGHDVGLLDMYRHDPINRLPLAELIAEAAAEIEALQQRVLDLTIEAEQRLLAEWDDHDDRLPTDSFDEMADLFTARVKECADWKHSFMGAAYATRIKAAIANLKAAIAEAEQHPEIGAQPHE